MFSCKKPKRQIRIQNRTCVLRTLFVIGDIRVVGLTPHTFMSAEHILSECMWEANQQQCENCWLIQPQGTTRPCLIRLPAATRKSKTEVE